jgi:hypothetical protein
MSNKFALSDVVKCAWRHANVVLVSWPDSPEISPLALEVSIPSVDWVLAQYLDSSCKDVDRVLFLAGLFRLIYAKAFNIYYMIREQEVFVLFIIDGSISLNQELADPKVSLPEF